VGIRNCTKPLLGIKVDIHGYQKIKYLILIYDHGYQNNQMPNYHMQLWFSKKFRGKNQISTQTLQVFAGSFMKPWQFEILESAVLQLWNFLNIQNCWVVQKSNTHPTLVKTALTNGTIYLSCSHLFWCKNCYAHIYKPKYVK
jgi:hypothetical protein